MSGQQRIIPAAELAGQRPIEPPHLRLADPGRVFAARADRLDDLARRAPADGIGPYLGLIARLARAQHRQLEVYPGTPALPDAAALARVHGRAMPPLAIDAHRRDPSWRAVLDAIVRGLCSGAPPPLAAVLDRLAQADGAWIEAQADHVLHQREVGLDRATAIFIGAALQVHWTHLVRLLGAGAFPRLDVPNVCPCCGSDAMASVLRETPAGRHRYLVCCLCSTEWYFVRIKCATCDSAEGIEYFHVEGQSEAVKAETCPKCLTYTKIFYPEKDLHLDPAADDLASLDLDLALAAQTGFHRATLNLAFFPGAGG